MLWQDEHPQEANPSKDNPYHQNQWGMVIDLNTCTGCNACITACNTENNIQVVGKEQVANGREMMWLRMDRYFVTDEGFEEEDIPPDPNMVTQPVPCMHCENAPCESVCPVAATVHSDDGTNQMIYNRCVGTRYCSNNCPYKVRRFNYYKWSQSLPAEMEMAQNPDVTMRSRGVMEKCSYCIQRIRETGRRAQLEEREIRDGEVQTACQQACPADAITFGDQSDPTTKVSKKKENARRYEMLDELNVKPRTSYLGRVRNLSDDLAPASSHGKTEPQHEAAPAEGDAHS
jgi:molybdopterin-containing oxidoreductase family iron-sulfur binding subunit